MKNKKTLLVTISTADRLDWVKQLFSAAYFKAQWGGDMMLLAHDVPDEDLKEFEDSGILVKRCQPISVENTPYYHAAVFNKFYLFTPEFKQWDNVVYLDSDILIRSSIDDLCKVRGFAASQDFGHNLVRQFSADEEKLRSRLGEGYNFRKSAFNSGVMAFSSDSIDKQDFKKLRSLCEKMLDLSHNSDQSLLNLFFYNRWKRLSLAFNVPYNYFVREQIVSSENITGIMIHMWHKMPSNPNDPLHGELKENIRMFDSIKKKRRDDVSVKKWSYFQKKFYLAKIVVCCPGFIFNFLKEFSKRFLYKIRQYIIYFSYKK